MENWTLHTCSNEISMVAINISAGPRGGGSFLGGGGGSGGCIGPTLPELSMLKQRCGRVPGDCKEIDLSKALERNSI